MKSPYMKAETLRNTLTRLGWSGHELARRIGCSQSTVSLWSNGHRRIPVDVSAWLAAIPAYDPFSPYTQKD